MRMQTCDNSDRKDDTVDSCVGTRKVMKHVDIIDFRHVEGVTESDRLTKHA